MKKIIVSLFVIGSVGVSYYFFSPELRNKRMINSMVEKNIDARGGEQMWKKVSALSISGDMDVGNNMHLPYQLDQARPGKSCIEFEFSGEVTSQCLSGNHGWVNIPFRGQKSARKMTREELKANQDFGDLYGPLWDFERRGSVIEFEGDAVIKGKKSKKIKITLAQGNVRRLYLDAKTGLELKMESTREVRGKPRTVETYFYDWKTYDGLIFASRQESRTEGDDSFHFLTIKKVEVNPSFDKMRFEMPVSKSTEKKAS